MDRAAFDRVVAEERLGRYLHYGPPTGTAASKVCLWSGGGWFVAVTDERAGTEEGTWRAYADEESALVSALDQLRYLEGLRNFRL